MGFLKVIDIILNIFWLFLFVALLFSFYNIIVPFVSIITQGQNSFKLDVIRDPETNAENITFRLSVKNLGLMDNRMNVGLKFLSSDGKILTADNKTNIISPSSTEEFLLKLSLSENDLEKIPESDFIVSVESRTLFDLVGIKFLTKTSGDTFA